MSSKLLTSVALLGVCLSGCSNGPITERRDLVKEGMSLGEVNALIGEPNNVYFYYYWPTLREVDVNFVGGKVDHVHQAPKWPSPVERGMTEQQVLSLIGKPDWVSLSYEFGSSILCVYKFKDDRLFGIVCGSDTQLDRRYEAIAIGNSRSTIQRYFGVAWNIAYVYARNPTSNSVLFDHGKVLYGEGGNVKKGMTINEVVGQRGKPVEVCDQYDAPTGGYGWSFCYDDRERLVRKSWSAYPVP